MERGRWCKKRFRYWNGKRTHRRIESIKIYQQTAERTAKGQKYADFEALAGAKSEPRTLVILDVGARKR